MVKGSHLSHQTAWTQQSRPIMEKTTFTRKMICKLIECQKKRKRATKIPKQGKTDTKIKSKQANLCL
jgi:hypothetical protein